MLTKEYLNQKYVVEGLSIRQVATKASLNPNVVRKWLKVHGIPRRTKSEALSGIRNPMFGVVKSDDVRRRTSETLSQTNQNPEVRAKRSKAVSGSNNPMFGKTHTPEVREASRVRLKETRKDPTYKAAQAEAMRRPGVRQALSEAAAQKTGVLNPFFGHTHSSETKGKISQANRGRFQGANGSNWKGGRTTIALLVRNSGPSVAWRKAVFDRDSFTCQKCGKIGGKLNADHIRPFAMLLLEHKITTIEEAYMCTPLWDIANGRTLCLPCHKQTPSYAGNFSKNYNL